MIRGVAHLGIAVSVMDEAIAHYRRLLDVHPGPIEDLPERGVRVCVFRVGEIEIELIAPVGPRGEAVRRFLEKRGEGIHHVCLEVDDVQVELDRLQAEGFTPVGQPGVGAAGRRVAFLRPEKGLLVELAEPSMRECALDQSPD